MGFILLCLLASLPVMVVEAFSTGAPLGSCLTMFPKHHNQEQQSSPAPFTINVHPHFYAAGDNITVTISAQTDHVIRGLQIRAHQAKVNVEKSVGRFVEWPDDKLQPVSCFGQTHTMLTHKNNGSRTNIAVVWAAPDEHLGDIVFTVSVVESFNVFWSQMTSPLLKPRKSYVIPNQLLSEAVDTSFDPIDWSQCGHTKGCVLFPSYCRGQNCYAGVSFAKTGESYTFEMFAEAEGYVSVGFSDDTKMGDDQTISCTAQGDRVTVQSGFNHRTFNERMISEGLTDLQTMQADGLVYCRFTRPRTMQVTLMSSYNGHPERQSFDLDIGYFLFLAWGSTFRDSDTMKKHTELPIISNDKINFSVYSVYRGSSIPLLVKWHGCLMIVAWIALAGVTVFLSRYFKQVAGYIRSKKSWFYLHVVCASILALLTLVGMGLILYHLKGKTTLNEHMYGHAVMGFIVFILTYVQVLMGICRPSSDHNLRFQFSWTHRILGKTLQILSAAAMLLSFQWDAMPRVARDLGTIVVLSWIAVQIPSEIILEIWLQWERGTEKKQDDSCSLIKTTAWYLRWSLLHYFLVPMIFVIAGLYTVCIF